MSNTTPDKLDIKQVDKKLNKLQFPIYSMTQFNNYVLIGGGGGGKGKELANCIEVYHLSYPDMAANILRKKTHTENTGNKVANFMENANGLNVIAACLTNYLALYKFHVKEGKISLL